MTLNRTSTPCARCGASIAEGYAFCPACGLSVAAGETQHREPSELDQALTRRSALATRVDLVGGVLLAVLGVVLLVVADQHEPTLENAMKGHHLFTQSIYDTLKMIAWICLGVGAFGLLSAAIWASALGARLARSAPRTPTAARHRGMLSAAVYFPLALISGVPVGNAVFTGVLIGGAGWGLAHFLYRDRFPNTDAAERPPRSMRLAERLSSSGNDDAGEEAP